MKQSDFANLENQNCFNLDTLTQWINENISQPKVSPLQPLLQKQTLKLTLDIKSKKELLKSRQERVEKNNKILSNLVNPQPKQKSLELMEEEYDQQKCEKALQQVLSKAPKNQTQASNLPTSNRKLINYKSCPLVKQLVSLINQTRMALEQPCQEKKTTPEECGPCQERRMQPEQSGNPCFEKKLCSNSSQKKKSKSKQKIGQKTPTKQKEQQMAIEEQPLISKPQDDFIDSCIKEPQDEKNIDFRQHDEQQYYEIQPMKVTDQIQEKKVSSEIELEQIVENMELKTGMQQAYLEPLDAEIQIIRKIKDQQTEKMEVVEMKSIDSNRMEEE